MTLFLIIPFRLLGRAIILTSKMIISVLLDVFLSFLGFLILTKFIFLLPFMVVGMDLIGLFPRIFEFTKNSVLWISWLSLMFPIGAWRIVEFWLKKLSRISFTLSHLLTEGSWFCHVPFLLLIHLCFGRSSIVSSLLIMRLKIEVFFNVLCSMYSLCREREKCIDNLFSICLVVTFIWYL